MTWLATHTEEETDLDVLAQDQEAFKLLIYNDDVNTFEFVIHCIMQLFKYDAQRAEQLTLMIHYGGKAIVKEGEFDELEPLCTALLDRGLSAQIEK